MEGSVLSDMAHLCMRDAARILCHVVVSFSLPQKEIKTGAAAARHHEALAAVSNRRCQKRLGDAVSLAD